MPGAAARRAPLQQAAFLGPGRVAPGLRAAAAVRREVEGIVAAGVVAVDVRAAHGRRLASLLASRCGQPPEEAGKAHGVSATEGGLGLGGRLKPRNRIQ
jgi:hypothetical protein